MCAYLCRVSRLVFLTYLDSRISTTTASSSSVLITRVNTCRTTVLSERSASNRSVVGYHYVKTLLIESNHFLSSNTVSDSKLQPEHKCLPVFYEQFSVSFQSVFAVLCNKQYRFLSSFICGSIIAARVRMYITKRSA